MRLTFAPLNMKFMKMIRFAIAVIVALMNVGNLFDPYGYTNKNIDE